MIFQSTLSLESSFANTSIIESKSISHLTFHASIKSHICFHTDSTCASVAALIVSLSPGFNLPVFNLSCISGVICLVICLVVVFVGFKNCSICCSDCFHKDSILASSLLLIHQTLPIFLNKLVNIVAAIAGSSCIASFTVLKTHFSHTLVLICSAHSVKASCISLSHSLDSINLHNIGSFSAHFTITAFNVFHKFSKDSIGLHINSKNQPNAFSADGTKFFLILLLNSSPRKNSEPST
jgi:hypothetical protein